MPDNTFKRLTESFKHQTLKSRLRLGIKPSILGQRLDVSRLVLIKEEVNQMNEG